MKEPIITPVEHLIQEPYASILCFPNPSQRELQGRIQELHNLGVTALEFLGSSSVFGVGIPVIGKGFVGIVVVAHINGKRVAAKILRLDAGRADLFHEATMLSIANSVDVGPTLIAGSKNFMLMQLIDGILLPTWLEMNKEPLVVKGVLSEILEQCYRLDQAGLDHGELSKAPKHILIDKSGKPFILDFETASIERRVANVTAICQYLFEGNSSAAKILKELLVEKNKLELNELLRAYKKNKSRSNFEELLRVCIT